MAVHLHARLKTRYIPLLFTLAALISLFLALAHADEATLAREKPLRLDRRPGFSRIIVAPRPGERPSVGPVASGAQR